RLEHGHLVIGRWERRVWRSQGRFPLAYQVEVISVGPHALAFSYGWHAPRLYLARLQGAERVVASGEVPIGWTEGGVDRRRGRGGRLLLRAENGTLRKTLARQVFNYAYDQASGSLYFLARRVLMRVHGAGAQRLASLAWLALPPGRSLQLQRLAR